MWGKRFKLWAVPLSPYLYEVSRRSRWPHGPRRTQRAWISKGSPWARAAGGPRAALEERDAPSASGGHGVRVETPPQHPQPYPYRRARLPFPSGQPLASIHNHPGLPLNEEKKIENKIKIK